MNKTNENQIDAKTLQEQICNVLCEKKAFDVQSIYVKDKTIVADYYIVASGKSTLHVKSLVEYVEKVFKEQGIVPVRQEGTREGRWAVMDYGDVVLHVFNNEMRDFYCLERLWADENNVVFKSVDE